MIDSAPKNRVLAPQATADANLSDFSPSAE